MITNAVVFAYLALASVIVLAEAGDGTRFDRLTPSPSMVFKKLYTQKRFEQLAAVKQLLDMPEDRRNTMVRSVVEKIMMVTLDARQRVEGRGFDMGVDDENFPEDENGKHELAQILENAAFLGDVLLRFPEDVWAIFTSNPEWKAHFQWCLDFMTRSRLVDEATERMMKLVMQELGLVERDENFVNPYRAQKKKKKQKRFEEPPPPPKKKEKRKIKRGPRMSKGEL